MHPNIRPLESSSSPEHSNHPQLNPRTDTGDPTQDRGSLVVTRQSPLSCPVERLFSVAGRGDVAHGHHGGALLPDTLTLVVVMHEALTLL
jgi:hypothetical protein